MELEYASEWMAANGLLEDEDEDEDGAGTGLGNGVCKCLRPRLITGTSTKDGEFPATVTSRRSVRRLCLLYQLTLLLCLAGIQSVC